MNFKKGETVYGITRSSPPVIYEGTVSKDIEIRCNVFRTREAAEKVLNVIKSMWVSADDKNSDIPF